MQRCSRMRKERAREVRTLIETEHACAVCAHRGERQVQVHFGDQVVMALEHVLRAYHDD